MTSMLTAFCLKIGRKTVAGILRLIESERQGNSVDRMLCSELLRMLTSLGLYESSFQQDFLDDSRSFYEAEGLSRLQSSDIPAYLLHCEVSFPSVLSDYGAFRKSWDELFVQRLNWSFVLTK